MLRVPAAAGVLLGAASAVTWTYGRTHIAATTGADTTGTVLAWVALGVGGTATVLTASRFGALAPPRAWLITTSVVAAATACLGLPAPLAVAVLACAGFGWGFVAASSALIAWVGATAPGRQSAGTSVLFVALVLGQAAGAAAAGALAGQVGLSWAFLLASVVAVLAAAFGVDQSSGNADTAPTCLDRGMRGVTSVADPEGGTTSSACSRRTRHDSHRHDSS